MWSQSRYLLNSIVYFEVISMPLGPVMLDIEGLTLSPADRKLLQMPSVGGVILFSRNFQSINQVRNLIDEIRSLRNPALLIAVDHEGGRVQRFKDGFTRIPTMRDIGRQYDQNPNTGLEFAELAGWIIASELRSIGVDLSFGPCVDLDWGMSEVIGDRSFHRDPTIVSELATKFAYGLRSAGMMAVAKHFPGHGAVVADSHLLLPIDRRGYEMILDDMRPFESMVNTNIVSGIMLAHIIYSEIDDKPAGFSQYWVKHELRSRLNYEGTVFCDDLSMKATKKYGSMIDRAKLSLDAGCDMILICNDRAAAKETVDFLKDYCNPVSLVRLARLHGTKRLDLKLLQKNEKWKSTNLLFSNFC